MTHQKCLASKTVSIFFTIVLALIAFLASATYEAHAADTVVGRWCDLMVPGNSRFKREITIVATSNTGLIARTRLFDGSGRTLKLKEFGAGIMAVSGSTAGDKFRISAGSGELQLLDNDGYIRSARRLENRPVAGDCL